MAPHASFSKKQSVAVIILIENQVQTQYRLHVSYAQHYLNKLNLCAGIIQMYSLNLKLPMLILHFHKNGPHSNFIQTSFEQKEDYSLRFLFS